MNFNVQFNDLVIGGFMLISNEHIRDISFPLMQFSLLISAIILNDKFIDFLNVTDRMDWVEHLKDNKSYNENHLNKTKFKMESKEFRTGY